MIQSSIISTHFANLFIASKLLFIMFVEYSNHVDEIIRACSLHGRNNKCSHKLLANLEEKRALVGQDADGTIN
jgi:hypothetical protein